MLRRFSDLKNYSLAARDGEIGRVKELYFDDHSWTTRYVVVDTGGWLKGRKVLISPRALGEIDTTNQSIAVHLNRAQVEDSPSIDTDKPVSRKYEEEWHRHYDYPAYWLIPEAIAFGPSVMAPALAPQMVHRALSTTIEHDDGDPKLRSSKEVTGYAIHATDGDIGHLDDYLIDEEGWAIRYVVVSLSWWHGYDLLLSPEWIERISWEKQQIFVPLTRDKIRNAPAWDGTLPISREFESELFDHYGRPGYWPVEL
jgi:hypothetical protein